MVAAIVVGSLISLLGGATIFLAKKKRAQTIAIALPFGAGALLALRRGRPATDASGGAAGSATATPASGNATGEPPAGSPGASATPQVTS